MQYAVTDTLSSRFSMPRAPNPRDLSIEPHLLAKPQVPNERPISSPIALEGIDLSSIEGGIGLQPLSIRSSTPQNSQEINKKPSQSILQSLRPSRSRSASKDQSMSDRPETRSLGKISKEKEQPDEKTRAGSMSKIYHLKKAPGSTPELRLVGGVENRAESANEDASTDRMPQPIPHQTEDSASARKKEKQFRNPLGRAKSLRRESNSKLAKPTGLVPPSLDPAPSPAPQTTDSDMHTLKGKTKDLRGKSAERAIPNDSEENLAYQTHISGPSKEKASSFMSGSKTVLGKAKTGGGNFLSRLGKIGRSSSSSEKEVPDSEYQLKTINLPLLEQTRRTRISKKIESSKDKTEYWMPSLPWRCIDYLNTNCESEGLYRVPGSGPQVRHWQRRFDQELDVDLLDEQELYDPNTIGSMLKTWLRELPTEIFPQELQNTLGVELAKDNPDYHLMGQPAPQKLRDALSELPPYNYYLLFAITCHLSLLLSHQERNRMDLNNLSICIGPCLKMERWLFNYLVGDWRHCWQGCWTEKATLVEEARLEDPLTMPPLSAHASTNNLLNGVPHDADERAISSSGNDSTHSTHIREPSRERQQPRRGSNRPRAAREDSATSSKTMAVLRENAKPITYVPVGMTASASTSHTNSNQGGPVARLPLTQDIRRPSTAESTAIRDAITAAGAITPRVVKAQHGRSQSDLPVTPNQNGNGQSVTPR